MLAAGEYGWVMKTQTKKSQKGCTKPRTAIKTTLSTQSSKPSTKCGDDLHPKKAG